MIAFISFNVFLATVFGRKPRATPAARANTTGHFSKRQITVPIANRVMEIRTNVPTFSPVSYTHLTLPTILLV